MQHLSKFGFTVSLPFTTNFIVSAVNLELYEFCENTHSVSHYYRSCTPSALSLYLSPAVVPHPTFDIDLATAPITYTIQIYGAYRCSRPGNSISNTYSILIDACRQLANHGDNLNSSHSGHTGASSNQPLVCYRSCPTCLHTSTMSLRYSQRKRDRDTFLDRVPRTSEILNMRRDHEHEIR